jgi:hypothetical protein
VKTKCGLSFWRDKNGRDRSAYDNNARNDGIIKSCFNSCWNKNQGLYKLFDFLGSGYFIGFFFVGSFSLVGGINLLQLLFPKTFTFAATVWFVFVYTKVFGNIGLENRILDVWNLKPEYIEYQYK